MVCDVVDELAVRRRVGPVDPAREHRNRRTTGRERAPVPGLVDPERSTRDDRGTRTGERGRDIGGHVEAVGGRGA